MAWFNPEKLVSLIRQFRLSTIEDALTAIAMVGIAFMMLITTADVAGRYLLNRAVPGSAEILTPLMAVIVLLCLASGQRIGVHVGIDLLEEHLKGRGRGFHILRFFNLIVPLALFALVTVSGWEVFREAHEGGFMLRGILRMPLAAFVIFVPLGSFLLCLRLIVQMSHEVRQMIRGRS
ncbi:MAG: TRAP transporter small permease [Chloroflexi bacterium]|nr:TRAP transporter small permease [Chloroflexota bacterium]